MVGIPLFQDEQFNYWVFTGRPDVFWMTGFFNPQGIMIYCSLIVYDVAVSFIVGGNRSTWRKPTTCRKSLTNFIT
jgi:hypothetical protein